MLLMALADLVIEKVLLVGESLAAADVFQEEQGKRGGYYVTVHGYQFDGRLASVVYREGMVALVPISRFLKVELKSSLASLCTARSSAYLFQLTDRAPTLVDGHSRKVTSLLGMNFNKYSLIVSCLGEMKQKTFFGFENLSPCMPSSFAP